MILLVLMLGGTAIAVGGNEGHGGDGYVADFIRTGRLIHEWLATHTSPVSPAEFLKTLESASIASTDELLKLESVEKDAINYPALGKIVFNRTKWRDLTMERQRWQIVLHEILGLMGHEDGKYQMSERLVTAAFPNKEVLASQYRGTLPKCMLFFESKEGFTLKMGRILPVTFGLVRSGASINLIYSILDPQTTQPILEKTLISGLNCHYSNYHAGVMHCENAQKEEFSLSKQTTVKLSPYGSGYYDVADPYFYFVLTVRSKEVERMYRADDFVVLDYHPAATPITDAQHDQLLKGKLPLHLGKMNYGAGTQFQRLGAKVLGDVFSVEAGRKFCGFSY